MHIISDRKTFLKHIKAYKKQNVTSGFVPTMGNLHQGHVSLVRLARKMSDIVVVSIFVNPEQFAPNEDYNDYPRTLEADLRICEEEQVDIVFTPEKKDIYSDSNATKIYIPELSNILCGITRPHFFQGVCSVVLRLFNLIQPDHAYFGEKDFQQLMIIKKMVKDLLLPIKIESGSIIREASGLAFSSRNQYLSDSEKVQAAHIYEMLKLGQTLYDRGQESCKNIESQMKDFLSKNTSIICEYCEIVDSVSLSREQEIRTNDRIMFAGALGNTRLIDNICLEASESLNL